MTDIEVIKNYNTGTLDEDGNPLIGNNLVHNIYLYDCTEENWLKDFSGVANTIGNYNFTAPTVTGVGQWAETDFDTTRLRRSLMVGRVPFHYEDSVTAQKGFLHSHSPTASGNVQTVLCSHFVDGPNHTDPPRNVFPTTYLTGNEMDASSTNQWVTTSGLSNHGFITVDFSVYGPQTLAGFFIEPGNLRGTDLMEEFVGEYIIETSLNSPEFEDFTVVASGINPYLSVAPIWVEIDPVEALCVRLRFKNQGIGDFRYTRLTRFYGYTPEVIAKGMGVLVKDITQDQQVGNSDVEFLLQQAINFTGIDKLYIDVMDFGRVATNYLDFYMDGSPFSEIGTLSENGIVNAQTVIQQGFVLDTSAYNGEHYLGFRKIYDGAVASSVRHFAFLLLGKVDVRPSWFNEEPSSTRGTKKEFPDEALFVLDESGLSIIDYPSRKLWMRFEVGRRTMIEHRPRSIVARNGKVYMTTSRGLYVLDWLNDCCTRYDDRGEYRRSGIAYRNVPHINTLEIFPGSNAIPHRNAYGYYKVSATPVIPHNDLYSIVLGTNNIIGDYVFIGSSYGAILFNGSSTFYSSEDKRPVYNIVLSGTSLWYVQGTDTDQVLRRSELIQLLAVENFSPEFSYRKPMGFSDDFSDNSISDMWTVVNQDAAMGISEGSNLTISGTHVRGGATGLITRDVVAVQSFIASVKVRIVAFPEDARGGLHFGFCDDYLGDGVRSVVSSTAAIGERKGFFFSAFNANPYKGRVIENQPFDEPKFVARGWHVYMGSNGETDTVGLGMVPSSDGVLLVSQQEQAFSGKINLKRIANNYGFQRRDFTASLEVWEKSSFAPESATVAANPSIFFGTSEEFSVIPGTNGTSLMLNPAMVLNGNLVFGSQLFTGATYGTTGEIAANFTGDLFGPGDNSAIAPFREWKFDYNHGQRSIDIYVDNEFIRTQSWVAGQSSSTLGDIGLAFGISPRGPSLATASREAQFRNFKITYPPLASASRYKYGLQVLENDSINGRFVTYSGVVGLFASPNTVPATTTLLVNSVLTDGNIGPSVGMGANVSVGIDLGSVQTVEGLLITDTQGGTGWTSMTNDKVVQLWTSFDNTSWDLYRIYNFTHIPRINGVIRLAFSPAIEAQFFQLRTTLANTIYRTGGTTGWNIAEIQALKPDAIDFSPTDNTEDAEFRTWTIDYDHESRRVNCYLDGDFISTITPSSLPKSGRFVLLHDLSPVNSESNNYFSAEFKDFSVVYKNPAVLSSGVVNSLKITRNETVRGSDNLTIFSAADNGLTVFDTELPVYINRFDTNTTGWIEYDYVGATGAGSWSINSGRLIQSGSAAGKTGLVTGNLPYGTHFVYDLDPDPTANRTKGVSATIAFGAGSVGFAWCRQDHNNFYYFISSRSSKEVQVGVVIAGVAYPLYQSDYFYLGGSGRHIISIRNNSTDFDLYINNRYISTITDSTFSTGKLALISNASSGDQFTDVGIVPSDAPFDQVRLFKYPEYNISGASTHFTTIVADDAATRDDGLIYLGNNQYTQSHYNISHKRPFFIDSDPQEDLTDFEYGVRLGLAYHPGVDKVYTILDRYSPYILEIDRKTGLTSYLQRYSWRQQAGMSPVEAYQSGAVQMLHCSFDDLMWFYVPEGRLGAFDVRDGSSFMIDDPLTINKETSNFSFAYIMHQNRLFLSQNQIALIDLETRAPVKSAQNYPSSNANYLSWIKNLSGTPWFSDDDLGGQSAVYCDYDACVYILAGNGATAQFRDEDGHRIGGLYKFNPDKAGITVLEQPPFAVGNILSQRLVYVPHLLRIYAMSAFGSVGELFYYDVVNENWVRANEDIPPNIRRGWPQDVADAGIPGTTIFPYYDSARKKIVIWGRGRDALAYEYDPGVNTKYKNLDYLPSRDGLPNYGVHRLLVHGEATSRLDFLSSYDFSSDYYEQVSSPISTLQGIGFGGSEFLQQYGTGSNNTTYYRQYYTASQPMEATRSFEVNVKVALPQFTTDIYVQTASGADPAEAYFIVGIQDGLNPEWVKTTNGQPDPGLYQSVEIRAGVSGVVNNPTLHGPFAPHLVYIDGFNRNGSTQDDILENYTSYGTSPIDFGSAFEEYKDFKIVYQYETDTVEGFVDGVSIGATTMRRKFNKDNGVRFKFGFRIVSDDDANRGHFWEARIKDLDISGMAVPGYVHRDRYITTVSGAIGSYYYQRWDSTITSGVDWVLEQNIYLPNSHRYPGHDYICSLIGIGDGKKLFELAAIFDGRRKKIGVVSEHNSRHDSHSYLTTLRYDWSDSALGDYRIIRDIQTGLVNVYLDGALEPAISLPYDSLPSYTKQHVYYGKLNYGTWEKIYDTPSLVGSWSPSPPGVALGKVAFNSTANFATIAQVDSATATYTLASGLEEVNLYVFYHASNSYSAPDAPYTVYAGGIIEFPQSLNIISVTPGVDEFGEVNFECTTVRVDQRRKNDGVLTNTNPNKAETSGWVYIGKYTNPTKVVLTANASGGSVVCADAIGVEIGKYGKSTFTTSLKRLQYLTGATVLPTEAYEESGLTGIDLASNEIFDAYTEKTAPSILDGDITSGAYIFTEKSE